MAEVFDIPGSGVGADYCAALLDSLGFALRRTPGPIEPHPALQWAACGAMHLTGPSDGPPLIAAGNIAACAGGAGRAFALLASAAPLPKFSRKTFAGEVPAQETAAAATIDLEEAGAPTSGGKEATGATPDAGTAGAETLDGAALLGERAALFGLVRRGSIAPGGSCRLLEAADAWIAINLARDEDLRSLAAWIEDDANSRGLREDPWPALSAAVACRRAGELVERARLLGMAVAIAGEPPASVPPWLSIAATGRSLPRYTGTAPRVIDLSSLWAGPLCAQLLADLGAEVIKVESSARPDGARRGHESFYDLLNAGKLSVALDFASTQGREQLRALLESADIVVESSRPRALRQLGIDAEALVAARPGLTWVSITGYGRREPGANWIAFGDDASAAAGLTVYCERSPGGGGGVPMFCGDAIADPLTGLHAAVAALAWWSKGGGVLLDLSLHDVAAHLQAFGPRPSAARVRPASPGPAAAATRTAGPAPAPQWEVVAGEASQVVLPPRARRAHDRARALGADNQGVLGAL